MHGIIYALLQYLIYLEVGCPHEVLLVVRPGYVGEDVLERVWHHTSLFNTALHPCRTSGGRELSPRAGNVWFVHMNNNRVKIYGNL